MPPRSSGAVAPLSACLPATDRSRRVALVAGALLAWIVLHRATPPQPHPKLAETVPPAAVSRSASRPVFSASPVPPLSAPRPSETPSSLAPAALLPPADLAAALALAPGEARAQAFGAAIERWILNEPESAATWIPRLADPVEFDRAAALLVIRTDTLHRPTALALDWAQDIASPELRRLALLHVLREWAERDPDAAIRHVENSPAIQPSERSPLLAALTPFPPET